MIEVVAQGRRGDLPGRSTILRRAGKGIARIAEQAGVDAGGLAGDAVEPAENIGIGNDFAARVGLRQHVPGVVEGRP